MLRFLIFILIGILFFQLVIVPFMHERRKQQRIQDPSGGAKKKQGKKSPPGKWSDNTEDVDYEEIK